MASEATRKSRLAIVVGTCLSLCLGLTGACRAGEAKLAEVKKGEHYRVLAGRQAGKDGGRVELRVQVTDGWKLNEKAPFVVRAAGSGGITPAKAKLRKKDARKVGKHTIDFELPYSGAAKPGAALQLKFDFVICTDTLCQKKRFSCAYPLGDTQ